MAIVAASALSIGLRRTAYTAPEDHFASPECNLQAPYKAC